MSGHRTLLGDELCRFIHFLLGSLGKFIFFPSELRVEIEVLYLNRNLAFQIGSHQLGHHKVIGCVVTLKGP